MTVQAVKRGTLVLTVCILCHSFSAQISSPGMGRAKTASWVALGLSQRIGRKASWRSVTYIGAGRKSDPDNYNPVSKQSLLVFNEELSRRFFHRWHLSGAGSFRTQDIYRESTPYDHQDPPMLYEFRVYSRLTCDLRVGKLKFSTTLRQELRNFWPDSPAEKKQRELRSRLRFKATLDLDAESSKRVVLSSEQLFASDYFGSGRGWDRFRYRESRFSIYYSRSVSALPLVISFGYMNDLVGGEHGFSAHYLCFDVVIRDPFDLGRSEKVR